MNRVIEFLVGLVFGIGLILAGVLVLNVFSGSGGH